MRVPHVLMAAATIAVLGLGIYLFHEVRSAPASPHVGVAEPVAKDDKPVAAAAESPPSPTPPAAKARPPKPERVVEPEVAPERTPEEMQKADPSNDSLMDEANKAYDKQDFDEARQIANRILAKDPSNVRMLRVLVSAACVEVDQAEAAKWLAKLPTADQGAMKTRCTRYGVTFPDAKK